MTLQCPHCGGAISLIPDANADANPTQTLTQTGTSDDIAHGSEVQVSKRVRTYNQGYDQQFLLFWEVYPRKRDKRKAQIAWRNAVRRLGATPGAILGANQAAILAGAIRYRDDPNRVEEFTKYAEGWLNGDGWEDEPLPARTSGRPIASVPMPDLLVWVECGQCGTERRLSEIYDGRCVTCRADDGGDAARASVR